MASFIKWLKAKLNILPFYRALMSNDNLRITFKNRLTNTKFLSIEDCSSCCQHFQSNHRGGICIFSEREREPITLPLWLRTTTPIPTPLPQIGHHQNLFCSNLYQVVSKLFWPFGIFSPEFHCLSCAKPRKFLPQFQYYSIDA